MRNLLPVNPIAFVLLATSLVGQAPPTRPPAAKATAKAHYQPRMVQPGVVQRVNTSEEEGMVGPGPARPNPDQTPPGTVAKGSAEAAERQEFLLQEAARTLGGGTQKPVDPTISQMILSPVIDAKTGLIKEDAENLDAKVHNQPAPHAPAGRRARLAELSGISPDEAAKLYPIPETKPYEIRDIHTLDAAHPVSSQEEVAKRLLPGQNQQREEMIKNALLTDAEASFAVYAALGMPFPIRVGKVDMAGTTKEGLVLFSPDLLRADPLFDQFQDLQVTFRFMQNETEIYRDTVHVKPYTIIPRPSTPVTHLWVSCDKDVMIYAIRGVSRVPRTVDEVRQQVQADVVPVNSWLRVPTKLYGIRWGLIPTVEELTKNVSTRQKLAQVLSDTGLLKQNLAGEQDNSPMLEEFRQMADKVKTLNLPHKPK